MLAVDKGLYVSIEQVFYDIGYARDCEPPARLVALVTKCVERAQQLVDRLIHMLSVMSSRFTGRG